MNNRIALVDDCMNVLKTIQPINKDLYDDFDNNTWCTAGLDTDGDLYIRVVINKEEYGRLILTPGSFKTDDDIITQARDLVIKTLIEYETCANADATRTFREQLEQDVENGCMSETDAIVLSKMALNNTDMRNLLMLRAHTIHSHYSNLVKVSMF